MPVTIVLGEQRGDEGKGRFVDVLAKDFDIVARYNGGPNAGHTVVLPDGRKLKLHVLPSGVAYSHTQNVVGNGLLVDAVKLCEEIATVSAQGITISPKNLFLSSAAHLLLPQHISEDIIREAGAGKQGSTKSGIAPAAAAKYLREGIRLEAIIDEPDRLHKTIIKELKSQRATRKACGLEQLDERAVATDYVKQAKLLIPYITDTTLMVNRALRGRQPVKLLAESAQAFWLDIDHGMYPYTTSSSPTAGGVATGLGIPPSEIKRIIGVVKATQSHVGDGPMVTEVIDAELLDALRGKAEMIDAELGTTTGRWRRIGYLDLPQLRRAQMVNGTTEMAITKLDRVPIYAQNKDRAGQIPICVSYEQGGEVIDIAPDSAYKLSLCKPKYQYLPAWSGDIQHIRRFEDLPVEAQNYIVFIEKQTGLKVSLIGVGPQREQYIKR